MLVIRNESVVELIRGLKAFLRLEAGLTRGPLAEGGASDGDRLLDLNRRLGHERERRKALEEESKALRVRVRGLSEELGREKEEQRRRAERLKQARERLAEKDRQIAQLQNSTLEQAEEEPVLQEEDDELMPPEELMFVGRGGKKVFKQIGERHVELFEHLAGLKPDERVLDAGCGVGRMAIPLTRYLSKSGSYEGFDIVPRGIKWCQENITPKYPNFRFQVADVYNKRYNERGRYKASEYKFPYEDEFFDFVFLTSVFTHLVSEDTENYLSEITRVLRSGGRCYATFFLLNEESLELMKRDKSTYNFKYELDGCWAEDEKVPEKAIAYDEDRIRKLYEERGLNLDQIHHGNWCGREDFLMAQDITIAIKG